MAIYDSESERRYRQSAKGRESQRQRNRRSRAKRRQFTVYFSGDDLVIYNALLIHKGDSSLSAIALIALKGWLIENAHPRN